jgi:hypothetical protein
MSGRVSLTVATDVDQTMLARAREACFEQTSLRELPPHLVRQAFDPVGRLFCVGPEHRKGIEFLHQDMRSEAPALLFDLILCRYVAFTFRTAILLPAPTRNCHAKVQYCAPSRRISDLSKSSDITMLKTLESASTWTNGDKRDAAAAAQHFPQAPQCTLTSDVTLVAEKFTGIGDRMRDGIYSDIKCDERLGDRDPVTDPFLCGA